MWLATLVAPGLSARWNFNLDLTDILGMHYWVSEKFNPAQLITYMFMHGGFNHLFFNMFALYMFGGALENVWGPKRFLFFYLFTGVGAGIIQQLFWAVEYQPLVNAMNNAIEANSGAGLVDYQAELMKFFRLTNLQSFDASAILGMKRMLVDLPITVGASGAIFGILLGFGWLFPEARMMLIFFPVPIKARIFVLLYGVIELFLGVSNFSGDNVAHFAHLGGMLFGIILILIWRKKKTLRS